MINRFFVIILMLFLIPFSAIYGQDANVELSDSSVDNTFFSPVRIGYTPQQLYDANVICCSFNCPSIDVFGSTF